MLIQIADFLKPVNALKKAYRGIVIYNKDPRKLGRIRVFIPALIEGDKSLLPWCFPKNPYGLGGLQSNSSFSVPEVGSEVLVEFPFDDIYTPVYTGYIQSDATHQGLFDEDYPESYGFRDRQNWFKVNKVKQYIELQHGSGSLIRINKDGSIEFRSGKKVSFVSTKNSTEFSFDLETGDVNISPKNKYGIESRSLDLKPIEMSIEAGSVSEKVIGAKVSNISGGKKVLIGGSESKAIVSNKATSVGGDCSELVAGKTNTTYGQGLKETVVLGDMNTDLLMGNKKTNLVVGNYEINIKAGNIEITTKAGNSKLGNVLGNINIDLSGKITITNSMCEVTMSPAGDIKVKNTIGAGMHISPAGKVALGGPTAELLDLFAQCLQALISHTHGTGTGPSSPPMNMSQFQVIKTLLSTIKGSL